MPYINLENRKGLDLCVEQLANRIKVNSGNDSKNLTNEEVLKIAGDINYCFSRICLDVMGEISYGKIAILTGVLENIKQEMYRRVATSYEDLKIIENGDLPELSNLALKLLKSQNKCIGGGCCKSKSWCMI